MSTPCAPCPLGQGSGPGHSGVEFANSYREKLVPQRHSYIIKNIEAMRSRPLEILGTKCIAYWFLRKRHNSSGHHLHKKKKHMLDGTIWMDFLYFFNKL